MTDDNVIPLRGAKPAQHLPELVVQMDGAGRVTTVLNLSEVNPEHDAFPTEITPVFDGRFFITMTVPGGKLVWIVETFGIIRPASPIETKLWLENRAMTAEPTEDELQRVSQALLRVMANPKEGIAPQLLGYAAEMCAKLAARTQGQRLPTFSQKDGIEPEAV